jgi:hypothetical protein
MTQTEKSHIEQLKKAAELVRIDASKLTPAGYMKLQEDLYEFVHGAGIGIVVPIKNLTDKELRNWKLFPELFVKEAIDLLKEQLGKIAREEGGFTIQIKELSGAQIELRVKDKSSPFTTHLATESVQAVSYALFQHLAGSGLIGDRIQICRLCRNVFILGSHARQDHDHYCSTRCSRYAATKIYRAKAMLKAGKSIAEIAEQFDLDPKWLEAKLKKSRRSRRQRKRA